MRRPTPPHSCSPGRSRPPSGPRGSSCSSASTAGTCLKHPTAAARRQEPDTNYRNRVENARPIGFFCAALRSFAEILSYPELLALPASLHPVIFDVDGRGTNLSVFLFIADLLVPRCDLLDWQLPWSRQHTMPVCPATPWGTSPANSVAANRPRGLKRGTNDVICCS